MSSLWTDDPSVLASPRWAMLRDADPEATIFHSAEYLSLYRDELGAGAFQAIVVGDAHAPVAAAAFELEDGIVRFLGGTEVTDYRGPVGLADARDRGAKELVGALVARTDWERADLGGLPRGGTWYAALVGAAEGAGLTLQGTHEDVAPFLDLPASWDRYLGGLKGKLRHEIRRKERRIVEAHPALELVDATAGSAERDLRRFFEMHRSSEGDKGRFMDATMETFFRRLAATFLPSGAMRLLSLTDGDETLASLIGFRWGDRFLMYNSAFSHEHRHVAPGMVLVARLIRRLIEDGCRGLDMLTGDLEYKYRFGARARGIGHVVLTRG